MQAQGKHQEALEHVQGPGQASFVMAAERGALIGCLMVCGHSLPLPIRLGCIGCVCA